MCSRSCASRSRSVSYEYNFAGVLDLSELAMLAALATHMRPATGHATHLRRLRKGS